MPLTVGEINAAFQIIHGTTPIADLLHNENTASFFGINEDGFRATPDIGYGCTLQQLVNAMMDITGINDVWRGDRYQFKKPSKEHSPLEPSQFLNIQFDEEDIECQMI